MKNIKRLGCTLLAIVIILQIIPIQYCMAGIEEKYPYVIYASAQSIGAININASNVCINGNLATNGTILSKINGNINGAKLEDVGMEMLYVSDKIDKEYFYDIKSVYRGDYIIEESNINLNNACIVKGNFRVIGNANLNSNVKAYEDIVISGQVLNANNCIFYSEYGDIELTSDNINVTGLIYAPFGNVNIKGRNVNLNNIIIIAKTVNFDCDNLNVNYNNNMAQILGVESQEIVDVKSHVFTNGSYDSENKCIKIEWFTNCDSKRVEILESSDNINYNTVANLEKEVTFLYYIQDSFFDKYIKVGCVTEEGEVVESIPIHIVKENESYIVKLIDTDDDGISDALEILYGTDIDREDTDNDGLSDYQEINITKTNPLVYDSVETQVKDAICDLDEDGICNIDEILLNICPISPDSDGDGLNDEREINIYYTNPSEQDTDNDGINDGDEIALKLDPLNPDSDGDGILDKNESFETYINKDDAIFNNINTDDNEYKINVSISATGNAKRILEVKESSYTAHIENKAQIGKVVELFYDNSFRVDDCSLVFEIKEEYISNANCEHLIEGEEVEGIKKFKIFRYYEDIDMLLPIETWYNIDENEVCCSATGLGTYCLINIEEWLNSIGYEEQENNCVYAVRNINDLESVSNLLEKTEYNGHTYGVYGGSNVYTWEEAKNICEKMGGHLVSINSQAEQEFVAQIVDKSSFSKGLYWIGGYRNSIDKYQWYWCDGTKFTYENWNDGEPNDLGSNEYYVHMYKSSGKWNDTIEYLDGNSFYSTSNCGFVCEWENPVETTYEILLGANWSRAKLADKLSPNNSADTDGDRLVDWNEVNIKSPLVHIDSNGEPIFPTVSELVEMGYPFEIYDIMYKYIGIREYLYGLRVVPCNTNPLKKDTDGDKIDDFFDKNPTKVTFKESDLERDEAKVIKNNAEYIKKAAEIYNVDPQIVAACIYAEQALNVDMIDTLTDWTAFYIMDTSVGIGQVRMSTAEFLEKEGYMAKTSAEECIIDIPLIGVISGTERMARCIRLENDGINVLYVAAYLRYFVDEWSEVYKPIATSIDILASLYNLGHDITSPNSNPSPNSFGKYAEKKYDMMYVLLQ